jgi:hypothetical protein
MPSARITGIEDPKLLELGATNYFAMAWEQRGRVSAKLGRVLTRDETSVAVNSIYGRSQDQLHLHIDCLDAGVHEQLKALGRQIGTEWSRTRIRLGKHADWARRLESDELKLDPFRLLVDTMPGARAEMGAWTLVLAGETGADGRPGFYLLANRADPAHGRCLGRSASGSRLRRGESSEALRRSRSQHGWPAGFAATTLARTSGGSSLGRRDLARRPASAADPLSQPERSGRRSRQAGGLIGPRGWQASKEIAATRRRQ